MRDAKVDELNAWAGCMLVQQHDVLRLQVKVRDALGVQVVDTVQDLLLAAVRNADKYNETSDAGFLTFAHSVMQKAAFRAVRKNNSPSAKIIANAVPIEEICGQEDTDDPPSYTSANIHLSTDNAPDSSIKRWETIVKVRLALAGLPEDLQEVCRLLMDACTIQEIACSLDISRKTVRYRMEKIRENFVRANTSVLFSSFHPPSPHVLSTLYVHVSIPALQIGSSLPFFLRFQIYVLIYDKFFSSF